MYHARVGGFADSNKSDYYYNRNVSDATDLKPVCLRPNVPPGKNVGPVVSHSCHVRRRRFPHVLGYPAGPPSRSTRKRTRKRPTVVVVARRPFTSTKFQTTIVSTANTIGGWGRGGQDATYRTYGRHTFSNGARRDQRPDRIRKRRRFA